MWTQTVIGQYTNGSDIVVIEAISHDHFNLLKNKEYEESFYSAEDLQAFLEKEGFGILDLPQPNMELETWHVFNGYEEGETGYLKIFSKLKANNIVQSVIFAAWRDKTYSVFFREMDYSCLDCVVSTALEFVEEVKRNPKNFLELDAYEMSTHGASGMDDTHRGITSMEDVKTILKYKYNIEM